MISSINVLDHGKIELEYIPEDIEQIVVRAARICYQSFDKSSPDSDARLIEQGIKNEHNTIFEHVPLRFYIKAPIFVARQIMRHRICTFNELSMRYNDVRNADYYTPQSIIDADMRELWDKTHALALDTYATLLSIGIKREQARAVLPVSMYTEFIWSLNLWSLLHWMSRRISNHAQWEHRQYAEAALEMLNDASPLIANCFTKYMMEK